MQHVTGVGPVLDLPPETSPPEGDVLAPRELGDGLFHLRFPSMGTICHLALGAEDEAAAAALGSASREELARLEALFSEWRSDSPVSAINALAGVRPVEVPREVFHLIERALRAARDSDGAFDPTWAGMRHVWRFGDSQDGVVPAAEEVESARSLVDHRAVVLDPARGTVFLPRKGMALGLGGIAKGYAVDRVASLLRAAGVESFLIRFGGDLYAGGTAGGRKWRVGIQDPRDPRAVVGILELEDEAFSTSGDYERFFVVGGNRYHHIIDPSTGWPATASRSVTARCASALAAEVVTKPVFIRGPAEGIPFALAQGCEVAIVDAAGALHLSPGLAGSLLPPPSGEGGDDQGIPTSGAPDSR